MEFDSLTIAVLVGVVYGPIAAWQGAERPATPWRETSIALRVFIVAALIGSVAAEVVLIVIGRPLLAALLAASALLSYLLARHRRSHNENQPVPTE